MSSQTLHDKMPSEKQTLILQRVEETRLYLEGPNEPADAWRDYAAYLAEVAKDAYHHLDAEPEAPVVTHWRHLSAWLRRFAPTGVVESVAGKLALKTAGGSLGRIRFFAVGT